MGTRCRCQANFRTRRDNVPPASPEICGTGPVQRQGLTHGWWAYPPRAVQAVCLFHGWQGLLHRDKSSRAWCMTWLGFLALNTSRTWHRLPCSRRLPCRRTSHCLRRLGSLGSPASSGTHSPALASRPHLTRQAHTAKQSGVQRKKKIITRGSVGPWCCTDC